MNKFIKLLTQGALALAAVVAVTDASLLCVGPFGQPEVPQCLKK